MRDKHYYIFGYKKKDDKFEFCFSVKTFYFCGFQKQTLFYKSLPMDNIDQLERRIFDGWIISKIELKILKPWAKLYSYYNSLKCFEPYDRPAKSYRLIKADDVKWDINFDEQIENDIG